ncbi:MAG TPA: hypothetical protein VG819_11515 [Rhizomicrobium sp.]|nr:hypothetical protein [Rhizomicrobium sp.]
MNGNRRRILDMLAAGRVTAGEAEQLLSALERAPAPDAGPDAPAGAMRYLRILVERAPEREGEEPAKVNIRVPLRLLHAGVKLGSLLPEDARVHLNEALREKGVDIDVSRFKGENLDDLLRNLNDLSIDIDKKSRKAKIRIFCE